MAPTMDSRVRRRVNRIPRAALDQSESPQGIDPVQSKNRACHHRKVRQDRHLGGPNHKQLTVLRTVSFGTLNAHLSVGVLLESSDPDGLQVTRPVTSLESLAESRLPRIRGGVGISPSTKRWCRTCIALMDRGRKEEGMTGKILVAGGYGRVGSVVAATLAERFPGRILIAGRNLRSAQELAAATGGGATATKLDTTHPADIAAVLNDGVGLVLMCVENRDAAFAEQCVRRGIHYVDVSATRELLSELESLDRCAKDHEATVALSVGVAPGLTNLLAAHCRSVLGVVARADIFLLIGMGEVHGRSSNEWMLDKIDSEYSVRESGMDVRVESFGEFRRTVFPGEVGKRTAFRFNFSDQHTITKTLGVKSASTWACFDSVPLSWSVYLAKRARLLRLLRMKRPREVSLNLLERVHLGSDLFIAQVAATGISDGEVPYHTCWVRGHGEGRATSLVAAEVAEHLYTTPAPRGVLHVEQLFHSPKDFIKRFALKTGAIDYQL